MDITDPDGEAEAKYVGLTSGTSSMVEFFVNLDALGTKVTARTSGGPADTDDHLDISAPVVTLEGGTLAPATVPRRRHRPSR